MGNEEPVASASRDVTRGSAANQLRMPSVAAEIEERHKVEPREVSTAAVWVAMTATFAAIAYAQAFVFPHTPRLPWGDEVLFLIGGQKLAAGQVMYRDFFEIVFPGADVYYAALILLFGSRAWLPAATLVVLGTSIALTVVAIASRIMPRTKAVLAGLLFLAVPFYAAPIATHHWFSTELSLLATLIVLKRGRYGLVAAGALCALASFFTQTKGVAVVVAICLWLLWRREVRQSFSVAASFAVTLLMAMLPFIARAGVAAVFENTFTFVLRNYTAEWFNTWRIYLAVPPHHSRVLDAAEIVAFLFVHATVPFLYLFWAVRTKEKRTDEASVVALVGVAMFLAVASAPNLLRLSTVAAPAMVLVAGMLNRRTLRVAATLTAAVAIFGIASRQAARQKVDLPVGRVAVNSPAIRDEMAWLVAHTQPGQFCYGNQVVCFNIGMLNPAPTPFVMASDYTPEAHARLVVAALENKKVPLLVLRPTYYMSSANARTHLQAYREYVETTYTAVRAFPSGDEVWVRKGVTLPR